MEVVQGSVIPEGRETVHGGLGVMERGELRAPAAPVLMGKPRTWAEKVVKGF